MNEQVDSLTPDALPLWRNPDDWSCGDSKDAELASRYRRFIRLLGSVTALLLDPGAEAPLVPSIFSKIAPSFGLDVYFHYLFDPAEQVLRLDSSEGVPEHLHEPFATLDLGEALCGTAAVNGRPLVIEMVQASELEAATAVKSMGVKAYACHPLFTGNRLIGTLSFASTTRDGFEPDELEFFGIVCHHVSLAKEREVQTLALREAKEKAESASRAKDDFLAALSHELRTPLNPVLLLASSLEHCPELPPSVQSDLGSIRRNVELEARLIDDLLDITRITRGKLKLEPRAVSAHRLLEYTAEILAADIEAKSQQLNLTMRDEPVSVMADPVRLQQVFWNVLKNAVKFTPSGGSISVVCERINDDYLRVSVADSGIGIQPDQLESIFEAFGQGEQGRRFGGLGLGLAITRRLLELQGGRIQAESAGSGKGSLFNIDLPCAPGTAASRAF